MFELRQDCRFVYPVKTRVIEELKKMVSQVRDLERAGCGSSSQIRRVLNKMIAEGDAVRLSNGWYGLRRGEGYKIL